MVVAQVVFLLHQLEQLETSPAYLRNAPKAGFLGLGQLPIAPALEQRLHLGSEPNKHSGIII